MLRDRHCRTQAAYDEAVAAMRSEERPLRPPPSLAAIRSLAPRPRPRPWTAAPWRALAWAAPACGLAAGVAAVLLLREMPPAPSPGEAGPPLVPPAPGSAPRPAPAPAPEPAPAAARDPVPVLPSGVRRLSDPRVGIVEVAEGARIRVESFEPASTLLRLDEGRIDATVTHRENGSTFTVVTPFVSVSVVGTRFSVDHRPGVETVVGVAEGVVAADSADRVLLAAGTTARFGPAGAPVISGASGMPQAPPLGSPRRPAAIDREPVPPPSPLETLRAAADRARVDGNRAELARVAARLGDLYAASGSPDPALAAYREAEAAWPGTPPEGLLVDLATLLRDRMGRKDEAAAAWLRYLDAYPGGAFAGRAEAVEAFVAAGRSRLSSGDLDAAAAWFGARVDAPAAPLAEAALLGLMRVRFQQGRNDDVIAMAAAHALRFPDGGRKHEVARLRALAEGR